MWIRNGTDCSNGANVFFSEKRFEPSDLEIRENKPTPATAWHIKLTKRSQKRQANIGLSKNDALGEARFDPIGSPTATP